LLSALFITRNSHRQYIPELYVNSGIYLAFMFG
jgi:hypothetical protein